MPYSAQGTAEPRAARVRRGRAEVAYVLSLHRHAAQQRPGAAVRCLFWKRRRLIKPFLAAFDRRDKTLAQAVDGLDSILLSGAVGSKPFGLSSKR